MNRNSPKMLSDPAPSGWPSKNRACFVQNCNRQRACMNRNACRCIFRQKSPLETSWNLQIACELLEKKENKNKYRKKIKKNTQNNSASNRQGQKKQTKTQNTRRDRKERERERVRVRGQEGNAVSERHRQREEPLIVDPFTHQISKPPKHQTLSPKP